MSQLPPCSRGGTVRAPSAAILFFNGGLASGGTRVGLVAISAASRAFHASSIF
jgi:hypothetical protein